MDTNFIIRFRDHDVQPASPYKDDTAIKRVVGFVEARHLLPIIDNLGLEANPRSAKVNPVVGDIIDTLTNSPDLFHFKSKGLLLGCANYEALDRGRFRLSIEDNAVEGILDGGHNALAIGLHILSFYMDDTAWRKIKFWDDMKECWIANRDEIEGSKDAFDFVVPVELLVPATDTAEDIDLFMTCLLDICAARNNNAELVQEAKANKKGFYDAIREAVPESFAKRVEWKPNSWDDDGERKPIKVRDVIALAWLPLNRLHEHEGLPVDIYVTPQNIYRNKGECSAKFNQLLNHPGVCETDGPRSVLMHDGVKSAFRVLADLPELYDLIYQQFPEAYKRLGFVFGSKKIVKIYDPEKRKALRAQGKDVSGYATSQPVTPMLRRKMKYSYPDGLIAPLVYGLTGIMKVEDGKVNWAIEDPISFVQRHITQLVRTYKLALDMGAWDPQKISKNPASHELMVQQFKAAAASELFGPNAAA